MVLDANLLIRACLGVRVRALIAHFANEVDFYVAEANAAEAAGYIGELASRRGLDPQICQEAFAFRHLQEKHELGEQILRPLMPTSAQWA